MNAGILAAQILSTADAELANRVASYKSQMEGDVLTKAQSVESDWREHLKKRS